MPRRPNNAPKFRKYHRKWTQDPPKRRRLIFPPACAHPCRLIILAREYYEEHSGTRFPTLGGGPPRIVYAPRVPPRRRRTSNIRLPLELRSDRHETSATRVFNVHRAYSDFSSIVGVFGLDHVFQLIHASAHKTAKSCNVPGDGLKYACSRFFDTLRFGPWNHLMFLT